MSDPYSAQPSPSPYPDYYAQAPQVPAGTNRAAAVAAMLLLGVVLLYVIQGAISIYYYATAPVSDYVAPRQMEQFEEIGWSGQTLRTMYTVGIGACMGIIVLLLLVMVPFVKKGGRGATITTLVIAGLLAIFAVIGLLGGILQLSGAMEGPDMPRLPTWFIVSGLLLSVVTLLVLVMLIIFLARSLAERARLMQAQAQGALASQQADWQAYYAQQQQQQPPPPQPPPQSWGGPQG